MNKTLILLFLSLLVFVGRVLPHPPNFTPMIAVALFSGFVFSNRVMAVVVPILGMVLSDAYLGFHSLIPVVYAYVVMTTLASFQFLKTNNHQSLKLAGSIFGFGFGFFVISNFFVWLSSGMYPLNAEGLLACYTLAIPFYQYSFLGDFFYSGVLFGSYYLLNAYVFPNIERKSSFLSEK